MRNESKSGSMGIAGYLTLIFIVLKLTDQVSWSWWSVFLPIWLPAVAAFIAGVVSAIYWRNQ